MASKPDKVLTYETRVLLDHEEPALSILAKNIKKKTSTDKDIKVDLSDFVTKDNKVAVFASRNLTWSEVGKLYRGYTIVDVETAAKWITHPSVRIATPQEVAKEFNK